MFKKILFFMITGGFFAGVQAKTLAFFSPSPDCKNHLIALFNQAKKSIQIVIYALTDNDIALALEGAHARGVNVHILADRTQAGNKSSQVYNLYAAGVPIRVHSVHRIEHNKFAIIDDRFLETGSFNWTKNASESNSENCLFLWDEPDTIAAYQARFDQLWRLNTEKAAAKWFQK